jgi:catechol 2,3-dioxygenase-like lactoylglutathione lyase family enzyme
MASRGIDHVGVTSSDLDRSLRFYRDLLGMTVLDRGFETSAEMATLLGCEAVEFAYADLDSGDGRVFELLQYLSPPGAPTRSDPFDPGTPHVAVRVEDIDAVRSRLTAADTPVISHAPVRVDAPGTVWHGGVYLLTRDPDGVVIELVERPA